MSNSNEKVPLTRPRVSKKRKNEAATGLKDSATNANTNASNGLAVESGPSKSCRVMRLKEGPPLPPLPSPPPPSLPSVSALVSVQEEHVEPKEEVDVDVDVDVETVHVSTVGEEKFQTTDTVKRFRKACRDFYRETTETCLFIGQQAFADKERWSNEPPYMSLCQNDVSKLMRDITDRASILVERVEYLDSALSSLVSPSTSWCTITHIPLTGTAKSE